MSGGGRNTGLLIQPSALLPWSVEVVSAVPKAIMSLNEGEEPRRKRQKKKMTAGLDSSQINTGAVCPGWASLASWKGQVYVWSATMGNNGGSPSKKFSIDAPQSFVTLFHPTLVSLSDDSSPPLIAMTPASADAVFVYAAQPATGNLFSWKVTKDDIARARTVQKTLAYAHVALPLTRQEVEEDENDTNETAGELLECPTSLAVVDKHMVVIGTSSGGLICCTQSIIPLALHAQRMFKVSPSRQSLIGRIFGSSQQSEDLGIDDNSHIAFALPLEAVDGDEGCKEFLAVTLFGVIWHWKVQDTVATSHRVTTEVQCVQTLATLLMENMSNMTGLSDLNILQAKLRGKRLHLVVRVAKESDECRLFWVRLRFEEGVLHWIDCQWLNRFGAPQDVEALGLVLSENHMAYAAFHQRSGGVTSSVIVMAMADSEDSEASGSSSVEIYEVDLPNQEIPALLPGTFSNDIVTHGCSVFARSGLGIRVRVLTPTATVPLSPRAARRANPSAVLKLTNHLRSAFWHAYQHQGGTTGGSLALPPSIVDASSDDLEEAVIAVATQIHMQRSTDVTGWSSVSTALEANALEIHFALITWLRQSGIYRSLNEYGKWRLLGIGQEIAAFLDLVTPTTVMDPTSREQELMSSLSLASVGRWLKETLVATLRDGDADQYQLWCGWFSTALATSMTFRKERAGAFYDITHKPPIIGSNNKSDEDGEHTPRVPVWTSHPVLQESFGILLQHWNTKQKSVHVLPPQTVEVIARASLDSFSDSASSLCSERAIGKYAEIKALTIPLLRTLHPATQHGKQSVDMVAFQLAVHHEYYEGICQMSLDHENKEDADNFRLTSLLKSADLCQSVDFQTGSNFGVYVLNWFTDKGLYGHTLMYGRLCPEHDLNHILLSDERLRPHRWIQAIHKGDYSGAASSLMGQDSTATLSETKWSFCMARLSNHVVRKESQSQRNQAEERETKINKTLELVGVQNALAPQSDQHLWSANRLLSRALEQAEQATVKDNKAPTADAVKPCFLGLLVCSTFDDLSAQRRQAAHVWSKSIEVEFEQWREWIQNQDDLSRDALAQQILDTTVFGGLLKECGDEEALSNVAFSESMEQETLEQFGSTGESLRRLLRNVMKTFEANNSASADEDMRDVEQS